MTQIATIEPATVQRAPSMLDPGVLDRMERIAQIYKASGMAPDHLNTAGIIVALGIAARTGQDDLTVMQSLYCIKGKYGWAATYVLAQMNRSGRFDGPIRFDVTGQGDSLAVTAWGILSHDGSRVENTVTMQMAKAGGWTKNPIYRSIPKQMLCYRAIVFLCRLYTPEVMFGLRTTDEIRDIAATRGDVSDHAPELTDQVIEIVEATPQPAQRPQVEGPAEGWQKKAEGHLLRLGIDLDTQARLFGRPAESWGDAQYAAIRELARKLQSGETSAAVVCSVTLDTAPEVIEAEEVEPEPEPEVTEESPKTWSQADAIDFQKRIGELGLDYGAVRDLALESGSKPSEMTKQRRGDFLHWLATDKGAQGRAVRAFEVRSDLIDALTALGMKARTAAGKSIGLKTTAVAKLTAHEMRALLGAHDLAGEE